MLLVDNPRAAGGCGDALVAFSVRDLKRALFNLVARPESFRRAIRVFVREIEPTKDHHSENL
jgi:hypothetical protein